MPADHPIVTEEAIKAAEHAYIHGPEKTVPEMFGAALNAAAPLIQKQVEERVRERLESPAMIEAVMRDRHEHRAAAGATIRDLLVALDSLDQDPEQ